MPRTLLTLALAIVLSGCVAVWGRAYTIEAENTDAVTIKYDRHFTSAEDIRKIAAASCAQSGKSPGEPHETTSMWGLTTAFFACAMGQR